MFTIFIVLVLNRGQRVKSTLTELRLCLAFCRPRVTAKFSNTKCMLK